MNKARILLDEIEEVFLTVNETCIDLALGVSMNITDTLRVCQRTSKTLAEFSLRTDVSLYRLTVYMRD